MAHLPPRKPVDRPKYLLDTTNWTIRLYDDIWEAENHLPPRSVRELQTIGYGAISYAWGLWSVRGRTVSLAQNPRLPTFAIGNSADGTPRQWAYPYVQSQTNPTREQFTMDQVRAVFNNMGLTYVWWDWACIPQSIPVPVLPALPDPVLVADKAAEMNKMRYVYPHSTRGTIWAHTISWQQASALKTAIQECCAYMRMSGNTRRLGDVFRVDDALQDLLLDELWFKSLWCFQEAVLFTHPSRNLTSGGISAFRDKDGETLPTDTPRGQGDLMDLVTAASGIGATIINILRMRAEHDTPDPVAPTAPNTAFQDWCTRRGREPAVRALMDRLVATGVVFLTSQSPLSLLNARFNRERNPWHAQEDVEVNTLIGALEVDIAVYIAQAVGQPPDQRLTILRNGMLAEIFRTYQWRMLLLATPRRPAAPAVDMVSLWPGMVTLARGQTRPTYTALEYFLQSVNLMDRFKPPPPQYEGDPPYVPPPRDLTGQFALPALEYVTAERVLVLHGLPGFRVFDLTTWTAPLPPLWHRCMFYDFAGGGAGGAYMPIFRFVDFANWAATFGPATVLVPVEYASWDERSHETSRRLRCVVLSSYGDGLNYPVSPNTARAATFVGVVDIEFGGNAVDRARGNLELTDDVRIY